MFSRNVSRLEELHGLLPAQAVEILRGMVGQAKARLRHDGPIVLGAPSGGKFGDNELLEGSDFKFRGRALGMAKWGVATANSRVVTDAKTGKDVTWVEIRERDDQYGQYAAGYAAQGDCESWFCTVDTGPKLDLLLAPFGADYVYAEAGDVIPFVYDLSGTPVAIGVPRARERVRRARALADWEWVPGYEWKIGRVQGIRLSDLFATTAQSTLRTFYLPCSSGGDPNLHANDEFSWQEDEAGNAVAVDGYLDAKIGTIDQIVWGKGTVLRRGWRLYSELTGLFPVGFGNDPEYGVPGRTGGSHPIQPWAHDSARPDTWQIRDHDEGETTTVSIDLEIGTTTLYAATASANLSCQATSLITYPTQVVVTIPPHIPPGYYPGQINYWVDAVGGLYGPGEGFGHTEYANGPDSHRHDVSVGIIAADLRHMVTVQPHTHTIPPHTHYVTDTGHGHNINPRDHSHYVEQVPHAHGTPRLEHRGQLPHRFQDFRPPFRVEVYIVRVGPEED